MDFKNFEFPSIFPLLYYFPSFNISSSNINSIESNEEEETFNFPSLPWVCQKRFAEICNPKTLKTFASINESTKNLSKRCHFITKALIRKNDSTIKYAISCYCKENEFCNGFNESSLLSIKPKIMDRITVINTTDENAIGFIKSLPVVINSAKHIRLKVNCMNLDDLKTLLSPEIKRLTFYGGIRSSCTFGEFVHFIKNLSNLEYFRLVIHRFRSTVFFSLNDLVRWGYILQSQKFMDDVYHGHRKICFRKKYQL